MTEKPNEVSPLTRIPVRSRRQAMDWSLVLTSQGIEATIHAPGEAGSWSLTVAAADGERAFKTLRQYHLENRDWRWPQTVEWQGGKFDLSGVVWALILILFYRQSVTHPAFMNAGILDSTAAFSGQWWRIFTAMTLHADLGHLAANLSIGIVLLGLALGRYGTGVGFLFAALAGAMGNVFSLWLNHKPFHGLGASGMIMGALGLLAAQSLTFGKGGNSPRMFVAGLSVGIMLFVFFGLAPGTDLPAHLGGFAAGWLMGMLFWHPGLHLVRDKRFNQACGVGFVGLFAASWLLALTHP